MNTPTKPSTFAPEVIDHWTIPVFALDSSALKLGSANSGMRESRLVVIEDSEDALEVLVRPPAPGVELPGPFYMAIVALPLLAILPFGGFPPISQLGEITRYEIIQMALSMFMVAAMLWNPLFLYHMACRWTRLRIADGLITIRTPNWRGKEQITQFPLTGVAKHPPGRYELVADLHLSGGETLHKFKLKNYLPQHQVNWLQAKLEQRITTESLAAPRIQEPAHA